MNREMPVCSINKPAAYISGGQPYRLRHRMPSTSSEAGVLMAHQGADHLDVVGLQVVHGLFILLWHMAPGWPAHKVLPRAAQPIAEAGLPHSVILLPVTPACHGPLPDACMSQ